MLFRSSEIPSEIKDKIALFCNVRTENVIPNLTARTLYEVPMLLEKEGLARVVCKHLGLDKVEPNNSAWEAMIENITHLQGTVKIALVGKYMQLQDAYLSVSESLRHGGFANGVNVEIGYIDSETIKEDNAEQVLAGYDGILVPGGFGNRGIEGKILAVKYAREHKVPFLGICLGMQMAVVEFSRNVLGLKDASSAEFSSTTENPVIHIMETQKTVTDKGGTMRLGAYPCHIEKDTLAYTIYGQEDISERHRHRYEYNNSYKERLEAAGLKCSGTSPDGTLVEIVENVNHPFFIGVQFHPEFKSRPDRPAPLFASLVKAAKKFKN